MFPPPVLTDCFCLIVPRHSSIKAECGSRSVKRNMGVRSLGGSSHPEDGERHRGPANEAQHDVSLKIHPRLVRPLPLLWCSTTVELLGTRPAEGPTGVYGLGAEMLSEHWGSIFGKAKTPAERKASDRTQEVEWFAVSIAAHACSLFWMRARVHMEVGWEAEFQLFSLIRFMYFQENVSTKANLSETSHSPWLFSVHETMQQPQLRAENRPTHQCLHWNAT